MKASITEFEKVKRSITEFEIVKRSIFVLLETEGSHCMSCTYSAGEQLVIMYLA